MIILFLFTFIVLGVGILILYTNKSEPAIEIKSLLKKIYENLLDLFRNLKSLFNLISNLISQEKDSTKSEEHDDSQSTPTPIDTIPSDPSANQTQDVNEKTDTEFT